jgi:hypothetical protein
MFGDLFRIFGVCALGALLAGAVAAQAGPGYIVNSIGDGIRVQNSDGSNRYHVATGPQRQNDGGSAASPSVSADGQKIAFLRNQKYLHFDQSWPTDPGTSHVFVMNADGSGLRQVTFDYAVGNNELKSDAQPVIAPDGTKVAFLRSAIATSRQIEKEIFVVNTDGSNLRQVTQGSCGVETFTWGQDSRTLYFTAGGNCSMNGAYIPSWNKGVISVREDGSGAKVLTYWGVCGYTSGTTLATSPDGKRLAVGFNGCGALWLAQIDPASGALFNSVDSSVLGANPPVGGAFDIGIGNPGQLQYSPDSTRIAYPASYGYVYPRCAGGGLHVINADGTNPHNMLYEAGACWAYYGSVQFWWARGAALPAPVALTVAPTDLCATPGTPVQIFPELKDGAGRVLSRSAQYYSTGDSRVAEGDSFGRVWAASNALNRSTALTAGNGGLTAPVAVHNLAACSCAVDVSAQIAVTRSGFTYDARTGHFFQTVTIRNSGTNMAAPLLLAFPTLSANATVVGAVPTACAYRSGKPCVRVAATDLSPGAAVSVKLEFLNPTKAGITYTTLVLAGSGTP